MTDREIIKGNDNKIYRVDKAGDIYFEVMNEKGRLEKAYMGKFIKNRDWTPYIIAIVTGIFSIIAAIVSVVSITNNLMICDKAICNQESILTAAPNWSTPVSVVVIDIATSAIETPFFTPDIVATQTSIVLTQTAFANGQTPMPDIAATQTAFADRQTATADQGATQTALVNGQTLMPDSAVSQTPFQMSFTSTALTATLDVISTPFFTTIATLAIPGNVAPAVSPTTYLCDIGGWYRVQIAEGAYSPATMDAMYGWRTTLFVYNSRPIEWRWDYGDYNPQPGFSEDGNSYRLGDDGHLPTRYPQATAEYISVGAATTDFYCEQGGYILVAPMDQIGSYGDNRG